jgi:hypothetical protein
MDTKMKRVETIRPQCISIQFPEEAAAPTNLWTIADAIEMIDESVTDDIPRKKLWLSYTIDNMIAMSTVNCEAGYAYCHRNGCELHLINDEDHRIWNVDKVSPYGKVIKIAHSACVGLATCEPIGRSKKHLRSSCHRHFIIAKLLYHNFTVMVCDPNDFDNVLATYTKNDDDGCAMQPLLMYCSFRGEVQRRADAIHSLTISKGVFSQCWQYFHTLVVEKHQSPKFDNCVTFEMS